MPKPLIAVDLDEVLGHNYAALVDWHNTTYGTNHVLSDYVTEHWSEVWNVSPEEASIRAAAFHDSGIHANLVPVAGAYEALQKLKKRYRLQIITVRRQVIIDITHAWLARHYPGIFDDVHFIHFWDAGSTATKAGLCKELGAELLIDDAPKHCLTAAELGVPALLFGNYPWNEEPSLPAGVKRVADWNGVLTELL